LTVASGGGQAGVMSLPTPAPKKKLPLVPLAIAGVVAAVSLAAVAQLFGWRVVFEAVRGWVTTGAGWVTSAGPGVFFTAMAVLPAVGVPMAPFALATGPLFGTQFGFPALLGMAIVAMTVNLTATYWLARRGLRPLLTRLLERWGYRIPQVGRDEITDLIVLLRVTPGVPFFVQNYLLGLVDAPFPRYLALSCAIQWPINCGFMLFGDALSKGRGKMILTSVLLIAALIVATHMVRKRLAKKKAGG
jgi:uncharacterized membrane protein YdjX (TVP38/TMEM64 family)